MARPTVAPKSCEHRCTQVNTTRCTSLLRQRGIQAHRHTGNSFQVCVFLHISVVSSSIVIAGLHNTIFTSLAETCLFKVTSTHENPLISTACSSATSDGPTTRKVCHTNHTASLPLASLALPCAVAYIMYLYTYTAAAAMRTPWSSGYGRRRRRRRRR